MVAIRTTHLDSCTTRVFAGPTIDGDGIVPPVATPLLFEIEVQGIDEPVPQSLSAGLPLRKEIRAFESVGHKPVDTVLGFAQCSPVRTQVIDAKRKLV
jgi:hypothetical protein